MGDSGSNSNAQWYVEPVTSFNVDASSLVEYKGKYYCTMYTAFAYKLSGQTQKAWAITGIDAKPLANRLYRIRKKLYKKLKIEDEQDI